jgi:hypothetical protein
MSQQKGPLSGGRIPLIFSGTVGPLSVQSLSVKVESESFLDDLIFNFPLNQQRLVTVQVLIGIQQTIQDRNVLQSYPGFGMAYLQGDDNQVVFRNLGIFIQAGDYITVRAYNSDAVNTHTIDVQAVIRRVEAEI